MEDINIPFSLFSCILSLVPCRHAINIAASGCSLNIFCPNKVPVLRSHGGNSSAAGFHSASTHGIQDWGITMAMGREGSRIFLQFLLRHYIKLKSPFCEQPFVHNATFIKCFNRPTKLVSFPNPNITSTQKVPLSFVSMCVCLNILSLVSVTCTKTLMAFFIAIPRQMNPSCTHVAAILFS